MHGKKDRNKKRLEVSFQVPDDQDQKQTVLVWAHRWNETSPGFS